MPRTKFDKPRFPPIDKLRAVILERKLTMRKTWHDLAEAANISEGYLRRIVPTTPSDQWNPQIREALCRYLGIRIKVNNHLNHFRQSPNYVVPFSFLHFVY